MTLVDAASTDQARASVVANVPIAIIVFGFNNFMFSTPI